MNVWKKAASLAFVLMLLLVSGCGSDNKNDGSTSNSANATDTNPPQNSVSDNASETMNRMVTYFKDKGMELTDLKDIEQMDFAAHEGKSFTYQGSPMYLYRLKSNDDSMKALLDSAKKTGNVKVNIDGKQQNYKASVNGDYLLVYENGDTIQDFIKTFGSYSVNTPAAPNTEGVTAPGTDHPGVQDEGKSTNPSGDEANQNGVVTETED